MQNSVDHSPEDIEFNEHIFDIDFHPHRNLIAAGLITGGVELYVSIDSPFEWRKTCPYPRPSCSHEYSEAKNVQLLQLKHHQDACRSVLFGETGHCTSVHVYQNIRTHIYIPTIVRSIHCLVRLLRAMY